MTIFGGIFTAFSVALVAAMTLGSILFAQLDQQEQIEMGVLLTDVCAEHKFLIPSAK